jgi:hypothetical protein
MRTPDLRTLYQTCDRAWHGDETAWEELRALGRAVFATGGVPALIELQNLLHDYAVTTYGSRGRAGMMSAAWEAIDEWANL